MITDESERIPYFYTHGSRAVLCADCAKRVILDYEETNLTAYYYTSRLLACGHCMRFIGPETDEEKKY